MLANAISSRLPRHLRRISQALLTEVGRGSIPTPELMQSLKYAWPEPMRVPAERILKADSTVSSRPKVASAHAEAPYLCRAKPNKRDKTMQTARSRGQVARRQSMSSKLPRALEFLKEPSRHSARRAKRRPHISRQH